MGGDDGQGASQPESFARDAAWGPWVLEHGLPAMPAELGRDDVVPIACWAAARFGAVVFRSSADAAAQSPGGSSERWIADETIFYERTGAGWIRPPSYHGGSSELASDPLAPSPTPPGHVRLTGSFSHDDLSAWSGVIGSSVASLEVSDRDGVLRRAVDAPIGVVVVVADGASHAELRVLSSDGGVLRTVDLDRPVRHGWPRRSLEFRPYPD